MANNNPYKVNDPYQSNNSHQKNTDNNFKKMVKEKEKDDAQKAFDKILKDYQNAENNGLNIDKNYENIGAIRRYYNKYWLTNYLLFLALISLIFSTFSFFSKFAILSIPLSYILYFIFSKKLYLYFLFYTHKLKNKKMKKEISKYIFGKSDFWIFTILSTFLFMFILIAFHFTKSILLIKFEDTKFIQLIGKNFQSFDINNELFAYSILISISILIIFKIFKK